MLDDDLENYIQCDSPYLKNDFKWVIFWNSLYRKQAILMNYLSNRVYQHIKNNFNHLSTFWHIAYISTVFGLTNINISKYIILQ